VIAASVLAAFAAAESKAATIERLDVGRKDAAIFIIDGNFSGGETIELQRQIAKLPTNMPVSVILNSPGGSLSEGLQLGEFFYKARISTFVLGYGGGCHSACSLAFLGGRDAKTGKPSRVKMDGGQLGFHQFVAVRSDAEKAKTYTKTDMDNEIKRTRTVAFLIIKYLNSINEDMSKLHLMLKAPNSTINIVSTAESLALGINIMREDSDEFIESAGIQARVKRP
jgi:hypothetical protein